jgi:hypothetical protein
MILCPICYNEKCGCRFVHKTKCTWRDDDERLPLRSALCGTQHWSRTTPYRAKVNCPECLLKMSTSKLRSRKAIYGKQEGAKRFVNRRFF